MPGSIAGDLSSAPCHLDRKERENTISHDSATFVCKVMLTSLRSV